MEYLTIEQEIKKLSQTLNEFDDNLEKYQFIMEFGDNLDELPIEFRTDENKVIGCQSDLWISNFSQDKLEAKAYSEALIVRGLVGIVLKIYNGRTADEILYSDPKLLNGLGIDGILTPGRQNGVGNLIKKIYKIMEKIKIINAIKQVYDPEIDVNIYDLGLIYSVEVTGSKVTIVMTLTSAFCPEAEAIPKMVKDAVLTVDTIDEVDVTVTMDPPWNPDKISDEAKLELGIY